MGGRTRAPRRAALFDDTDRPTWLVFRSPWGSIIEQTAMPPGTDLVRLFITEMLRYHDSGWRLNDFSSFSGGVLRIERRRNEATDHHHVA